MESFSSNAIARAHSPLHPEIEEILAEAADAEWAPASFGALIQLPMIFIAEFWRSARKSMARLSR